MRTRSGQTHRNEVVQQPKNVAQGYQLVSPSVGETIQFGSLGDVDDRIVNIQVSAPWKPRELCFFGSVPVNRDFVAGRTRGHEIYGQVNVTGKPLPSGGEETHGGGTGTRLKSEQRGGDDRRDSSVSNCTSTTQICSQGYVPIKFGSLGDMDDRTPYLSFISSPEEVSKYGISSFIKAVKAPPLPNGDYDAYGRRTTERRSYKDQLTSNLSKGASKGLMLPASSQHDTKSIEADYNWDTLRNYGRSPLIRDFVAEAARPLPSSHQDSYGGGTRLMNQQIRGDTRVKMWHATMDNGGALTSKAEMANFSQSVGGLTPEATFPVHLQEEISKQKPSNPNKKKGTLISRLFR